MKKQIAETLANILENPVVKTSLDRSSDIEDAVTEVKEAWMVDLDSRNPAPAYKETIDGVPVYQGTDLDLFTFINALADRKAVINLPNYERIAPKTVRSDQRLISNKNRHGQILGVVANKETHSFNVRINDYQVVQVQADGRETVGAPRNFALVDYGGEWNDGWHKIEFKPDAKENYFLNTRGLWTGNSVVFKNFVHPTLANAFYGSRYLAAKALGMRVEDEARHYRQEAKELRDDGIKLRGEGSGYKPKVWQHSDARNVESIQVENLEAVLVLPEFEGKYPIKAKTQDGDVKEYSKMPTGLKGKQEVLRFAEDRAKELSYTVGPQITAATRAVELAYFKHGFTGPKAPGYEREPGWAIPKWQRDYTIGNGRTEWNALKLNKDVTLAYRIRDTSVKRVI